MGDGYPTRRILCGMVRAVDASVKNITDTYKRLGLWDDTLVVLTADSARPHDSSGNSVGRASDCARAACRRRAGVLLRSPNLCVNPTLGNLLARRRGQQCAHILALHPHVPHILALHPRLSLTACCVCLQTSRCAGRRLRGRGRAR